MGGEFDFSQDYSPVTVFCNGFFSLQFFQKIAKRKLLPPDEYKLSHDLILNFLTQKEFIGRQSLEKTSCADFFKGNLKMKLRIRCFTR